MLAPKDPQEPFTLQQEPFTLLYDMGRGTQKQMEDFKTAWNAYGKIQEDFINSILQSCKSRLP